MQTDLCHDMHCSADHRLNLLGTGDLHHLDQSVVLDIKVLHTIYEEIIQQ